MSNYRPYICSVCAKSYGATWPEDHVATWHSAICQYCNQEAGVCHLSDWNWPKGHSIGLQAGEREV